MKLSQRGKKRLLALGLALCALALTACQAKETFPTTGELPQTVGNSGQAASASGAATTAQEVQNVFADSVVDSVNYDDGTYDPASEEGGSWENVDQVAAPETVAPTRQSEYAGATPVVIDPIDKPTPTPLPKLTFAYVTYEAASLHMTFEAPAGWIVDDSQPDSFTLINPDESMDYPAQLTIRVVPVNRAYSETELTKEIRGMLDTVKGDYKTFSPSKTATRSFLGSKGVYANYSGTDASGIKVAGRMIASCPERTLYILHVSYPQGYTETYVDSVFHRFVKTVKMVED